jgi:hypothetical protein
MRHLSANAVATIETTGIGKLLFMVSVIGLAGYARAAQMPPPIEQCKNEPIKYVGGVKCDKRYYDGRLRYAIGVHNYQAMRANRTKPPEGGMIGWTYNHQPYLCYWNGRYYLEYLSNLTGEHVPPGRTLLMSSKDGLNWSNPRVLFPKYALPKIKGHYDEVGDVDLPAGTFSVMHQRMGFYIAPDGRLLTLAFYSFCRDPFNGPNNGQGLGRVVREVYKDGTFGPIYFIRYNRHSGWNQSNTNHPFYKHSPDKGFVKACDDLLANKLMTQQWQEEDMADDGFFATGVENTLKAFSWCTRPDGVVVGVWKNQDSALSPDNGKTWTKIEENESLMCCGAKTWIQKTDDGRYALVYNHSATEENRFPMTVMTGDDAHIFDDLLCLNGECPPMRFFGMHKNCGTQYFRGIVAGNGNPGGDHMWNTYSVNKEDIWVSRTPVPIRATADKHFSQDFEKVNNESELAMWNLYMPRWAPISIVEDPVKSGNKCLELKDEEPYDYGVAQRAFPESKKATVEFRIYIAKVGSSFLSVEVQDKSGYRPMCLRFDDRFIMMDRSNVDPDPVAIDVGRWYKLRMELDCDKKEYALYVDGKEIHDDIEFARTDKVESIERLVFRTGPWRGDVRQFILEREPATKAIFVEDLYGTDERSRSSVYLIDDVKTQSN